MKMMRVIVVGVGSLVVAIRPAAADVGQLLGSLPIAVGPGLIRFGDGVVVSRRLTAMASSDGVGFFAALVDYPGRRDGDWFRTTISRAKNRVNPV